MNGPLKPTREELLCRSQGVLLAMLEDGITEDLERVARNVIKDIEEVRHVR